MPVKDKMSFIDVALFLTQFNITKPNRKFEDGYENGTHCILSNGYYVCLSEKN